MTADYKFEGWVGKDPSAAEGNMVWTEFEPKRWEDDDVDIKVTHSGVCGSDLHVLRSGWGPSDYPLVVGHEVVGIAVRVGPRATGNIRVGDVVGVGAQGDACLGRSGHACGPCADRTGVLGPQYCPEMMQTYNAKHRNGAGRAYGGHALYHRAKSAFAFRIPDGLKPEFAAPMLCAGATVYGPLRDLGAGEGKTVGVAGIGGLGHFAVLFAKAMGAKVVAFSRTDDKREDALKLGADDFVATEGPGWEAKYANTLDFIINTSSSPKAPITGYMTCLKRAGRLHQVGAPEEPMPINTFLLLFGKKTLGGSLIASPAQISDMLQLAADKRVEPWVEVRPMADANQAMIDMGKGKPRFRYVLAN